MPADDRFVVRAYQNGDETAILDLFARSFHVPRSAALWRWKFENDPWGRTHLSVGLDEAGRLVSHYAGYPVPFVDGATELLAHQIGDTMTDPSIRHIGRGPTSILGRTASHFYKTFCDGKIAFNYGFNVANIQKFSLRFLRSDRVEPVTYRILRPGRLRPLSRWERHARGYAFELVREATPEYDELFGRVRDAYGFLLRRDARYLRWRYLECPDVPYVVVAIRKWRRLAGWIVFRVGERRFTWGDALVGPHDVEAILAALRHLVPPYPVEVVEGWFPPRPSWLGHALERFGFETVPEPQDLSLMCVPFTMGHAVSRMRERLYYTLGDSDLF
jgi:Acetyltransferase (GNAT) domain